MTTPSQKYARYLDEEAERRAAKGQRHTARILRVMASNIRAELYEEGN